MGGAMSRYVDFLSFSHCAGFVFCLVHWPGHSPASSVALVVVSGRDSDSPRRPGNGECADQGIGRRGGTSGDRRKPAILTWPLVFTPGVRRYALSGAPLGSQSPRVLSGVVGRQPGPRASSLVTSGKNLRRGVCPLALRLQPLFSPRLCADHVHGLQGTIGTGPGFCHGIKLLSEGSQTICSAGRRGERRASSEFSEYLGSGLLKLNTLALKSSYVGLAVNH